MAREVEELKASDLDALAKTATRPPGHCDDDKAWNQFVAQYAGQERLRPDLTDFALANAVFMCDRSDLKLIVYQTAAKERIRWLSIRLAEALARRSLPSPEAGGAEPTFSELKAAYEADGRGLRFEPWAKEWFEKRAALEGDHEVSAGYAAPEAGGAGWLIEITDQHDGDAIKWFSAGPRWNWTKDANMALRFSRKEDAERFGKWSTLDAVTGSGLRYTEHEWIGNAAPEAGGVIAEAERKPVPGGYAAPFSAHLHRDDTISLTDASGLHVAWFNTRTQLPLSDLEALEEERDRELSFVRFAAEALNHADLAERQASEIERKDAEITVLTTRATQWSEAYGRVSTIVKRQASDLADKQLLIDLARIETNALVAKNRELDAENARLREVLTQAYSVLKFVPGSVSESIREVLNPTKGAGA